MYDSTLKEKLVLDLHTVDAIKFGKFKLKSGIISPYYFDLRRLVSYPHLLELVADVFWERLRVLSFDIIAGVPYTALPIATVIVVKHTQYMILVRKEKKEYGTGQQIEGEYHKGQHAVIVDDVITNGESKFAVIKVIEEAGIIVKDIVVLLDRGQGGPELLARAGYKCHSILDVQEVFDILLKYNRIDNELADTCLRFTLKSKEQFMKEATPSKQKRIASISSK
ncbi:MAG: orotate phosphoribosyltransferase [bacterium]|nr:orotate phosphoribosyltransferase [bacterium]